MTRSFAAAAIAVLWLVFNSLPACAQSNEDSSSDLQCFPWQEMRNGQCVAKPAGAPQPSAPVPAIAPPAAPQLSTDPCGLRSLSTQCRCPAATHLDASSGTCVADAPVPPTTPTVTPGTAIACNGGAVTNDVCICPSGFHLMSTDGSAANGGTCIKTHADNCLGGELTVDGTCLCTGRVVMSGEAYGLEYVNGKCLPKRCPEQTVLRDGKCLAVSTTAPEPHTTKPAAVKEADEEDEDRRRCGRGMIHTHTGCVPARRRYPGGIGAIQGDLHHYYRNYEMPGLSGAAPRN
jgi:hypothetical protein